jgi:hypothetical protein
LARDLPWSHHGSRCGSTCAVLASRQFRASIWCPARRYPSGCGFANSTCPAGAARSNASGRRARQAHLRRPGRRRTVCWLPRNRRQGLAARARPHQRQVAMGRWQCPCYRAYHHRGCTAAEGLPLRNAADGRGSVVFLRGFFGCSLFVGAEPSQRRLSAGLMMTRGRTR